MWFGRRRRFDPEIAPDEIFLDVTNAPSFDRSRFEGRLEQPLAPGVFLVLSGVLGLVFLILIAQAWNLEIRHGKAYAEASEQNSLAKETVFATRGVVSDSEGQVLIQNRENEDGSLRREYRAPGFGHLLGYVSYPKKDAKGVYYDTTQKGLAGIEAAFEERVGGENGTILVERDALGNVQSQGIVAEAVVGENLALTTDARAQEAFYKAIRNLAVEIPYVGGAGVLIDVHTGAVKALVSYPEYDPNVLSDGKPAEVIAGYAKDKAKPYLDRAVAGLYAPGSIVKPFEAAGALSDGIISPNVTVNSTGSISIPNPYDPEKPSIFKDWKPLGVVDMRRAIAFSSDIYFYMLGGGYGGQRGLGIERIKYWFDAFGLESPTGIELAGEATGFVPTPAWKEETYNDPWRLGDTYHTAIGQYAMQVTPIAMARATAALANGGKLVTPTLLHESSSPHTNVPISETALAVAREGMRRAVTEGTAIGLKGADAYTKVAAKTGTAQTGMRNEFYNSWVIGFFPYENPKYAFVVVMEKGPAGTAIGGTYVMSQVLAELSQKAPEYFD